MKLENTRMDFVKHAINQKQSRIFLWNVLEIKLVLRREDLVCK